MQDVRLNFIKRIERDYILALEKRECYNKRKFGNDL